MTTKKELEEYYHRQVRTEKNTQVILIIIMLVLACVTFSIGYSQAKEKYKGGIEHMDVYTIIDKLNYNCGSSFITSCVGRDSKWCVFSNKCVSDGYCKSIYYTIEECLE